VVADELTVPLEPVAVVARTDATDDETDERLDERDEDEELLRHIVSFELQGSQHVAIEGQ